MFMRWLLQKSRVHLSKYESARVMFGKNLRKARRLKDISQEALALGVDLSRTYVSEVERAARNVSIDNMEQLALAIGIPLSDLLNPEMFVALENQMK